MAKNTFTVFGIPLTAKQQTDIDDQQVKGQSFVAPTNLDGATTIESDQAALAAGGAFSQRMNYGLTYKDEAELINKYRAMALTSDIDAAVDEIVNEVMSFDADEPPVEAVIDDINLSTAIKKKIVVEFSNILRMLDFNTVGDDLFRRWYIDGRLFHHIVVDKENESDGIAELRYIDPRKIKKIRELIKRKDPKTQVEIVEEVKEFYVFRDEKKGEQIINQSTALKLSPESISYVHSGIVDEDASENTIILSYLHKAIKPWNLLNMMEDAEVIYKISRAPERRIFYIDVGNLPKTKAENYMSNIITKYKNKLVYDGQTGTVKDQTNQMSMLEDIWLPRREGSRGTEVSTLAGGTGLGDIENIEYFRRKLYRALHIPTSRMEGNDNAFNPGGTEITRDEIKFSKFVSKLRKRFSVLFMDLLKIQLLLKNIITVDDWEDIQENLRFRYNLDLYFQEMKEAEIRNSQMSQLDNIDSYVGRYFSIEYVRKKILKQSNEEMKEIDKQIQKEKEREEMPPDAGYDPQGQGGEGEDEFGGGEPAAPEPDNQAPDSEV